MKPELLYETQALNAPFSLKSVDEGAKTFRGLSSTWDEDLGGDVIHEGAFARTIDHFKSSGRVIPLTDGHPELEGVTGDRVRRVIGKVIDAAETKTGVDTNFAWVPDDTDADAAIRRVKGGFITDLSIVYKATKSEREKPSAQYPRGRRHIHELKWAGVGLVMRGMNPRAQADALSVKSLVEALQADELTDEQKAALMALPTEQKAVLRALLDAPPAPIDGSPADTPKELAPEDARRAALSARGRRLKLSRLAIATTAIGTRVAVT
jgi:phage head maturation protease